MGKRSCKDEVPKGEQQHGGETAKAAQSREAATSKETQLHSGTTSKARAVCSGASVPALTKTDRRNAFLYCKFRDQQFALYDAFAKRNDLLMNTFLVLNALYYAEDGMAQSEICARTFQSKQTVNLIIKNLLRDGHAVKVADPQDKRSKLVRLTEAGRAFSKDPVTHITWAEDTAMALFTPQEQEQLINLSRRFTQNLTELVNGTYGEGAGGANKTANATEAAKDSKGADAKTVNHSEEGSEDDQ